MDFMSIMGFFYKTEINEGQPRFSFREAHGCKRANESCLDFAENPFTGKIYWAIGEDMAACYRPLEGDVTKKTLTVVLAKLAKINHNISQVDEWFPIANQKPIDFILDAYLKNTKSLLPDESSEEN